MDALLRRDEQSDRRPIKRPMILGLGGTLRPDSTSERALRLALFSAAERGAVTEIISAGELNLPMYDPDRAEPVPAADRLIDAVRRADGLIVSTPAYHGGISGLLKNALDYLQALASAPEPYLHNRAVGCIVAASGWQAGATTLTSIRSIVHALRGWPTPLGVAINSAIKPFGPDGTIVDANVGNQLDILGAQVVAFARAQRESVGGFAEAAECLPTS
jgi:FMN reductase